VPLVFVDGVRIDGAQEATTIDVGVRPSLLDDIPIESVARIEVVRTSGASLLGPGAANGAILISTKQGTPGAVRWSARAEYGPSLEPSGFPANYRMTGTNPSTGQPASNCDIIEVSAGRCTPTSLDVWNPLEQASPFRVGSRAGASVGLNGGPASTGIRFSATTQRIRGATADDDANHLGLGGSLTQHAGETFDLSANVGYSRADAHVPVRGNLIDQSNVILNGLLGTSSDDANHGYRLAPSSRETKQDRAQLRGSLSAEWRTTSWLRLDALLGRERLTSDEESALLPRTASSMVDRASADHITTTSTATATAIYSLPQLGKGAVVRTSVGYARWASDLTVENTLTGAGTADRSEARGTWVANGPWMGQRLSWSAIDVGAGIRFERISALGTQLYSDVLKTADVTWRAPTPPWASKLRVRAAYGEAVQAGTSDPSASEATLRFGPPVIAAGKHAERTGEIELGTDVEFGSRLAVGVTAFQARSTHLALLVSLPPSAGSPQQATLPAAKVRDEGIELTSEAKLIELSPFRWDASLTFAALRNRVVSLSGSPPLVGTDTRVDVGYPVQGYWTRSYRYTDVNRDGVIGVSEVQVDAEPQFVGPPVPTRESSFRSRVLFSRQLSATFVIDYRGGFKLANTNENLRCSAASNCRGGQDPSAALAEQAAYVAQRIAGGPIPVGHIQDASFTKLRELSLRWELPANWLPAMRNAPTALSLAALNLATWTGYDGLDPETSYIPASRLPRRDFAKAPLTPQLLLRVDIGERPR
jgi:outer membrane receptor protein involved in Fe transport